MNQSINHETAPSEEADSARRGVIKGAALLGLGLATAGLTSGLTAKPAVAAKSSDSADLTILNFALVLEQLELSFYTQAIAADTADQFLHGRLHEIAPVIRDNELQHVNAISSAITQLGATPAPAPAFRFPREAFISPILFARFAYTLEEIGVGAYLGAINQIQSRDLRRAAASIYGNETRHVALLRHLGGFPSSPRYYEGPLSVAKVQSLIAPYVAM